MNQKTNKILFAFLNSAIYGNKLDSELLLNLKDEERREILSVAKRHDLLHLVVYAMKENGLIDEKNKHLENEIMIAAYRHRQLDFEFSRICEILEAEKIPYIPLKGSVIRKYYPEPWMRTSCDIDILIHPDNIPHAIEKFSESGYDIGDTNKNHDVSIFSKSGVHLELHYNVLEDVPNLDTVLVEAWNHSSNIQGFRYEFTRAFFMFHIFAHMAYHFGAGGCGIRSLLDIKILKDKAGITFEDAKKLLIEANIYTFAEKISKLSEDAFEDKFIDGISETSLSYLIDGGVYGTLKNKVASRKCKNGNFVFYAFKRLFLPYSIMKRIYPILKKLPILLPFCYIHRIFALMFGERRKRVIGELNALSKLKESEIDNIKIINDYLGLQ